ncbi:hypothetical protein SAMN05428981_101798 [Bacillus sp. OV194]|nr:hypothetical protein SAMN05428981_101798 [Bacillus sp. OV194]
MDESILVGAGAPPPGTHGMNHGQDRTRLYFSNYGKLFDAHGGRRFGLPARCPAVSWEKPVESSESEKIAPMNRFTPGKDNSALARIGSRPDLRQMIKRALDTPLFFYNAINGVAATATIDADGIYNYVSQISGLGTWTHVVGSANGTLFFYDIESGVGAIATIDPDGNYKYVGSISGFGRWTHITGTSSGSVLFYNAYTGEGATARIDPAGNYHFVSSISGFGSWTHIAQTD